MAPSIRPSDNSRASSGTSVPTVATAITASPHPSLSHSEHSKATTSTSPLNGTSAQSDTIASPSHPSYLSNKLPHYFTNSPITTLLISPAHTPLYIHTTLLTTLSPFFRAALSPEYGFRESKEKVVVLEDESMEKEVGKAVMVEWFVRWAYAWGVDAGSERAATGLRKPEEEWGDEALWYERVDERVEDMKKWRKECRAVRLRHKNRERNGEVGEEGAEEGSSHSPPANASSLNASSLSASHDSHLFTGLNTSSDQTVPLINPRWLANSSLVSPDTPVLSASVALPQRPASPLFTPLLYLYLFADRNEIPILRSRIRTKILWIFQESNSVPHLVDVWLVWANTLPFSRVGGGGGAVGTGGGKVRRERMRQLILDIYRGGKTNGLVKGEAGGLEFEEGGKDERVMEGFWRELVGEMMEERDKKTVGDGGAEDGEIVIGKGKRAVRRPRGFYDEP
ncbi:MAG: hypothetical protein Q9160_002914 [Pyrenula sp. 1 TL-2023]